MEASCLSARGHFVWTWLPQLGPAARGPLQRLHATMSLTFNQPLTHTCSWGPWGGSGGGACGTGKAKEGAGNESSSGLWGGRRTRRKQGFQSGRDTSRGGLAGGKDCRSVNAWLWGIGDSFAGAGAPMQEGRTSVWSSTKPSSFANEWQSCGFVIPWPSGSQGASFRCETPAVSSPLGEGFSEKA